MFHGSSVRHVGRFDANRMTREWRDQSGRPVKVREVEVSVKHDGKFITHREKVRVNTYHARPPVL